LEQFTENPGFHFVAGDVADASSMRQLVRRCEPDLIYHLAALHFIPSCIANPFETVRTNLLGTQALLSAIDASPVKKFVLASTGDVYLPKDSPHAEGDPTGSQNIYGQSKLWCEQLIDLSRRSVPGVSFVVARFFNVYGPGETNPHVIPDILELLRKGDVLPLGNVDARRDYVYSSDIVEALSRLGEYEGDLDVVNVGTGHETSVREIVTTIGQILGRELSITRDERRFRAVDRPHLCADTSRLRKTLGWVPAVDLTRGLRELLRVEGLLASH
jgi:UDP-glucose 4-epimerase